MGSSVWGERLVGAPVVACVEGGLSLTHASKLCGDEGTQHDGTSTAAPHQFNL